jgi:pSer/pThr/pTyr-binding forkhead associated (FHA) protein
MAAAGLPGLICSLCRGENPPGMKFCRNCGTALGGTPPAPVGMVHTLPQTPSLLPSPAKPVPVAPAIASPAAIAAAMMPTPLPSALPPLGSMGGPAPRAQGSTIACPRCGTATPVGFAYCQGCGLHIQPIAPTDPGAVGMPQARAPSNSHPVAPVGIDAYGGTLATPGAAAVPASIARPSGPQAVRAPTGNPARGTGWGTAVLVNRDGTDGQRFSLTAEDTLIGRAGCDIAFDEDRFLSFQHARLSRTGDGTVTITPLDTLNGVFKKTDAPVELADGSTILVGREVLRFEKVAGDERTVHPLVRHGVALFGSPPREPWGRLLQLIPSGGYRDVRHLITEEVVLGREDGEIVFRDDAFMSRRHAALTWDGKRAQLTDLGSSNGTFVRITGTTTLKHGDHVRLGDQLLRIERS